MITPQLQNGDFVLFNGSFATVTGPQKIQQDVMVAVQTPYGSNRFHPRYGSLFSSYVGSPTSASTSSMIQTELVRIVQNYQRVQLGQLKQATLNGNTSPFAQNDLVSSIGSIGVTQTHDSFQVNASVNTAAGNAVNVSTSVTGS
jgi:phage baseplate assembly protein W